jgi:outer membrane protein TolC
MNASHRVAVVAVIACLFFVGTSEAQVPAQEKDPTPRPAAAAPRLRLTLQDALDRARKNSTQLQAALTTAALAREDQIQGRNALLPSVTYNNSASYTQGTGADAQAAGGGTPVFVANSAVHEYVSQADVHEAVDLVAIQNYRRSAAAAAVARAQADIASRGLLVTVVRNYYTVAAAQEKLRIAQKTAEEGKTFLKTTQNLEHGGEVAHSDVIKAELQMQDRSRQLREAELALLNARLDLAVLLFPDFNDRFELQDDLHATVSIPTLDQVRQQAGSNNPDLRAALEAVREAADDVAAARAAYLPSLTLDYFYGIDATHFAVNSVVDGQKFSNLGSSIEGTLNIPVWNWGTTQSRVKQSELRRTQAKRELSLAQRKVLADVQSLYSDADMALQELDGLRRSAELAADSLQLTTLRYKEGEAKVLDVVDAQTTFYSANSAYQDGAVRLWVALAGLQTLTGGWRIP